MTNREGTAVDHAQAIGELLAASAPMRRAENREPPASGEPRPGSDFAERTARPTLPSTTSRSGSGRDYSSALELIQEASEALRIAESRADELEAELQEIAAQASDVIRHLKEKVKAGEDEVGRSEQRVRAAETRASEAEAMLARFHDAIVSSFRPALENAPKERPAIAPSLRLIE